MNYFAFSRSRSVFTRLFTFHPTTHPLSHYPIFSSTSSCISHSNSRSYSQLFFPRPSPHPHRCIRPFGYRHQATSYHSKDTVSGFWHRHATDV